MLNAKSLLETLLGGVGQMAQSQAGKGLAERAKDGWNAQSSLGKGAIAGGLLGILLTQGGRRLLGTGLKVGGMAAIGGLAFKAYEDWRAGRGTAATALPKPDATGFLPEDPAVAEALATHLLQAMIAAAKADGHVTPEERAAIEDQLAGLGLGDEADAMIRDELAAPLDAERIAALAASPAEAAQLYAATLLVIDETSPIESAYLANLAGAMKLDPDLVARLHAEAAAL